MDKEKILALAEKCGATTTKFVTSDGVASLSFLTRELEAFLHAAIESYKAELLDEVGEPVLYAEFAEDGGWLGDASEYADHLEEPHALFTSDQVAAAIIKATKPLEERRCEICGYAEHHREHTGCLRTQLAAAQEEINEWRGKHDVACLTITKLQKQYEIQLAATSKAMGAEESLLIVNYQLAKAEQLWQVAQGRCDGLEEKLAKAEQQAKELSDSVAQKVAEACSAYMLNKNYNSLEFDRKYSAKEFCAGQKSTVEFLAKMIRSGEWRKFMKEV